MEKTTREMALHDRNEGGKHFKQGVLKQNRERGGIMQRPLSARGSVVLYKYLERMTRTQ